MCWQIQLPSTWYPQYPLSAALLGCNIKCPLMRPFSWQGPASFLSSEHNAASPWLHPVLDEENRRVYMDNLLSLMDKLHICIARSFHRGIVSCTMHKTVISAVERLMVSNEILLQCVTMGTSVSLHSLHALQLSTLWCQSLRDQSQSWDL